MDAVETAFARNAIGWAMDVTCEGATATLTCCSGSQEVTTTLCTRPPRTLSMGFISYPKCMTCMYWWAIRKLQEAKFCDVIGWVTNSPSSMSYSGARWKCQESDAEGDPSSGSGTCSNDRAICIGSPNKVTLLEVSRKLEM